MKFEIIELSEYATEVRFPQEVRAFQLQSICDKLEQRILDVFATQTTEDAFVLFHQGNATIDQRTVAEIINDQLMISEREDIGREIVIPVDYSSYLQHDIDELTRWSGLSHEELVSAHSSARYTLTMYGFVPGFCYLKGLPTPLQIPRKAVPGRKVPAGSVAIAAQYCGIYPKDLPGGWYCIGHTTFTLLELVEEDIHAVPVGTEITFKSIHA